MDPPASKEEAPSPVPAPDVPPPAPGSAQSLLQKALNAGTSTLQSFAPLSRICQHVCAFHCYAHDASRQVRAHHFCSHQSDDFRQCVIYDSGDAGARLIGIEYIIAAHLYEALPQEEKKYWHSHAYEVTSGQLVAPGVPTPAETVEMKKLVGTYGKTWHTWQVDLGHPLPYGPAMLMMSFTGDGQLDDSLLRARDRDLGMNTEQKREARTHLLTPSWRPHPGADQPWHTNKGLMTSMVEGDTPFRPPDMPGPGQVGGVGGDPAATPPQL